MTGSRKLTVRCPDCSSRLVIDAATGAVLSHRPAERPPAGGRDFDDLFQQMREEKAEAEQVFEREVAAQADRARLLEEKFAEALKRAEENPDERPARPFDFD
ncbi:MAG: hypothetical protein R3325_05825 [Thermoanaerobaculia bacterium]|nr:hypothetical protein [Thermoanaerobaculia bacterium]